MNVFVLIGVFIIHSSLCHEAECEDTCDDNLAQDCYIKVGNVITLKDECSLKRVNCLNKCRGLEPFTMEEYKCDNECDALFHACFETDNAIKDQCTLQHENCERGCKGKKQDLTMALYECEHNCDIIQHSCSHTNDKGCLLEQKNCLKKCDEEQDLQSNDKIDSEVEENTVL